MTQGFWKKLKKPILVLAPMADVTDTAFRRIIAKYGKPDVTWTEFVSADGLASAGRDVLLRDLEYTEAERPIVAQLFTSIPEHMEQVAKLCRERGFDGIDINMGCPDRSIEKQGCGSAMIKNPESAKEIIRAAKRGAGDIPVSVKTRIGYNKNELDTWLPALLSEEPAVVTIHARTRKEMSLVPARWEHIKEAVDIRNSLGSETLIIGNGDVLDREDALRKVDESGADGAMLGRAIFGNPWLFNPDVKKSDLSLSEQLRVMIEHTKAFESLLGDIKSFAIMKKHYKAYVNGFDGAKELRIKLFEEAENALQVEAIIVDFLKNNPELQ
ncbi:MAG: tRNA-dihydrouridine synthase [Candidatus Paceibacterota bacterium]